MAMNRMADALNALRLQVIAGMNEKPVNVVTDDSVAPVADAVCVGEMFDAGNDAARKKFSHQP